MGHEIKHDDPEIGLGCQYFHDPDNVPAKIYVMFDAVVACPDRAVPPNHHLFTLFQHDTYPCVWRTDVLWFGGMIQLQYSPGPPHTTLLMWDGDGRRMFGCVDYLYAPEHHIFENQNPDCSDSFSALGGIGTIMWFAAAADILSDFVIPSDVKIFLEFSVTPSGAPIYKFCIPKYSMNIKFLIKP